jgi:GNAT superfamily N-acetyltransferase
MVPDWDVTALTESIRELTRPDDPALDRVAALYEASFPIIERVPTTALTEHLSPRASFAYERHLLVAEAEGKVVAMATPMYLRETRCGFLMYIAVQADQQRTGLGSRMLQASIERCKADATSRGVELRGTLMEVERVEDSANLAERRLRQGRLDFFAKHGASVLTDSYLQPPAWVGAPDVPMNLLYLPAEERWPPREIIPSFYRLAFGVASDEPAVHAAMAGYRNRT